MDTFVAPTARQLAEAVVDLDADVEERAIASIDAQRLRRRVALLPELDRQIVIWRYGIGGRERLSRRSVGQRLGLPVWRVRAIEEHALELLRGTYLEAAA